jgi:AcrR family transcriptional regulator
MSQVAPDFYQDLLTSEAELKATDARILDATVATFAENGFGVSMEDVARRAGVSRVTLYRRFTDRHALVHAVVLRESRRALRTILREISALESDEERFVRGFAATVLVARKHPLLKLLMESEPDSFTRYTNTTVSQVIDLGRTNMGAIIKQLQAGGLFAGLDSEYLAETLIRLWQSLVLTKSTQINSDNEKSVIEFARSFLYPLLITAR